MKKILHSIRLITALFFTAMILFNMPIYKVEAMEISEENDIVSFKIGNAEGVIGYDGILVEIPFGTDLTNVAPVIEVSGKATVTPNSGTSQNFSNPVTYVVTAENGKTKAYLVTVIGLAPTNNSVPAPVNTPMPAPVNTPAPTVVPRTTVQESSGGFDIIINGELYNESAQPTQINYGDALNSGGGNAESSGGLFGKENPATADTIKDMIIKISVLAIAILSVVLLTSGAKNKKEF